LKNFRDSEAIQEYNSILNFEVSAVCTVQQHLNVIKFHEAKLRPVSEKSSTRTKG